MVTNSSNIPVGPYPQLDSPMWRGHLVTAGLIDARCTLPEAALRRLALDVMDIKGLLQTKGRGAKIEVAGFKENAVEDVPTPYGTLHLLRGRQPGLAGAINQHNVRFAFDVVEKNIPAGDVHPGVDEKGAPLALLQAEFTSFEQLQEHLAFVEARLDAAERRRPYDLRADLEASGQTEPAVYHMTNYTVAGQSWYVPAATAGSNRTNHRAALFGLTAGAGILGLEKRMIDSGAEGRWTNPADWRDEYAGRLNAAWDAGEPEPDSETYEADRIWWERAQAAYAVATVPARFVIGFTSAGEGQGFEAALVQLNMRTHLHGPLDFTPENQALSAARALVDAAVTDGALTADEHAVLTGQMPVAKIAGAPRDAVVALVRLIDRTVYPVNEDADACMRVRRVLVEPAPSRLTGKHALARERVRVALLTQAIGGVDLQATAMVVPTAAELRRGIAVSAVGIDDVIVGAKSGDPGVRSQCRHELARLAWPGLVNGRVLLAPHGSTIDRRTPATKLAVAVSRAEGVDLFVEGLEAIADIVAIRAGMEPERLGVEPGKVRRVDGGGEAVADAQWFRETFSDLEDEEHPDATSDAGPTPSERWNGLQEGLLGKVRRAGVGVIGLRAHLSEMVELTGDGRGLNDNELMETWNAVTKLASIAGTLGEDVQKLRVQSGDDFDFGVPEETDLAAGDSEEV